MQHEWQTVFDARRVDWVIRASPERRFTRAAHQHLHHAWLGAEVMDLRHCQDRGGSARAVGGRPAALADRTDAEHRTGYVRGGISPLGQRQQLPRNYRT
jgi:hypothetical protein